MSKFKKVMKNSPEYQTVIKSQKDSEFFFDSILNASEPNCDLVIAAHRYNELTAEITR